MKNDNYEILCDKMGRSNLIVSAHFIIYKEHTVTIIRQNTIYNINVLIPLCRYPSEWRQPHDKAWNSAGTDSAWKRRVLRQDLRTGS